MYMYVVHEEISGYIWFDARIIVSENVLCNDPSLTPDETLKGSEICNREEAADT